MRGIIGSQAVLERWANILFTVGAAKLDQFGVVAVYIRLFWRLRPLLQSFRQTLPHGTRRRGGQAPPAPRGAAWGGRPAARASGVVGLP